MVSKKIGPVEYERPYANKKSAIKMPDEIEEIKEFTKKFLKK